MKTPPGVATMRAVEPLPAAALAGLSIVALLLARRVRALALEIKNNVRRATGLSCSIGITPNRRSGRCWCESFIVSRAAGSSPSFKLREAWICPRPRFLPLAVVSSQPTM